MGRRGPPARQEKVMISAVMGLLGTGVGVALVTWGAMVRRAMERDGLLHGAGTMPAGAAQEAS
jgi:hypothetical protein